MTTLWAITPWSVPPSTVTLIPVSAIWLLSSARRQGLLSFGGAPKLIAPTDTDCAPTTPCTVPPPACSRRGKRGATSASSLRSRLPGNAGGGDRGPIVDQLPAQVRLHLLARRAAGLDPDGAQALGDLRARDDDA